MRMRTLTPYVLWCNIQLLFRVKRRIRMDKTLRAEITMKEHARTWDVIARDTEDPNMLYVARYRAANCREMEKLLRKAWSAEYYRRYEEAQELRDRVTELHRLGTERASLAHG